VQVLSKMDIINENNLTNTFVQPNTDTHKILTYSTYNKRPDLLKKFKLPELKQIAKHYKLFVTGTKLILIQRIETFFKNMIQSMNIQRVFRGYIVRQSFKLRGEGFRYRKLCVNENDFYSLEPLEEIPMEFFYSFSSGKFVYGCNIISLIHLIQSKTVVKNPYNREDISIERMNEIHRLYRLIRIIYVLPADAPDIHSKKMNNARRTNTNVILTNPTSITGSTSTPGSNYTALSISVSDVTELIERRVRQMRTIRAKPITERIEEIFMEMDQLGNYTQSRWFSSLNRIDYVRLLRMMYDIWSYRGQLSRETKMMICILYDPFQEINRERINIQMVEIGIIKELCLRVMENMVYCGIDDEYRKIGTLHVLTALTSVSLGARTALPWLFETLQG
jgi:hypothetical protein